MSSVEKLHQLPSRNEFKTAMKEDRSKGIDGHNPSDERGKELENKVLKAQKQAEVENVEIKLYHIIYDAIEELRSAMEGMLAPKLVEKSTGSARVKEVFKIIRNQKTFKN
mgnify:CR=1 FL=1